MKTENHFSSEKRDLNYVGFAMSRMSQERLVRQVFLATPMGKWPRGRPTARRRDYITDLAWSRPGVEPAELPEIAENARYFESS